MTSTTVGYGDIYPLTESARWMVIIHHITSIILLIVIVGQVASITIESRTGT
ncbi:MAG: hypothetical protein JO007_08800 [Alphaproteobacteria bacterium]|nr:hypothetical protein [Alphaproteobacteria bacterium]